MTASEVLDAYLTFLWQQFQYDWGWMSNPWILYTFFPELLYLVFFTIKWMILLAPITVPIMLLKWPTNRPPSSSPLEKDNFFKN